MSRMPGGVPRPFPEAPVRLGVRSEFRVAPAPIVGGSRTTAAAAQQLMDILGVTGQTANAIAQRERSQSQELERKARDIEFENRGYGAQIADQFNAAMPTNEIDKLAREFEGLEVDLTVARGSPLTEAELAEQMAKFVSGRLESEEEIAQLDTPAKMEGFRARRQQHLVNQIASARRRVEQADREQRLARMAAGDPDDPAAVVQAALDAGLVDTPMQGQAAIVLPMLDRAARAGESERIDQLAGALGEEFGPHIEAARLDAGRVRARRAEESYFSIVNDMTEAGSAEAIQRGVRAATDHLQESRNSERLDEESVFRLRRHLAGVADDFLRGEVEQAVRQSEADEIDFWAQQAAMARQTGGLANVPDRVLIRAPDGSVRELAGKTIEDRITADTFAAIDEATGDDLAENLARKARFLADNGRMVHDPWRSRFNTAGRQLAGVENEVSDFSARAYDEWDALWQIDPDVARENVDDRTSALFHGARSFERAGMERSEALLTAAQLMKGRDRPPSISESALDAAIDRLPERTTRFFGSTALGGVRSTQDIRAHVRERASWLRLAGNDEEEALDLAIREAQRHWTVNGEFAVFTRGFNVPSAMDRIGPAAIAEYVESTGRALGYEASDLTLAPNNERRTWEIRTGEDNLRAPQTPVFTEADLSGLDRRIQDQADAEATARLRAKRAREDQRRAMAANVRIRRIARSISETHDDFRGLSLPDLSGFEFPDTGEPAGQSPEGDEHTALLDRIYGRASTPEPEQQPDDPNARDAREFLNWQAGISGASR